LFERVVRDRLSFFALAERGEAVTISCTAQQHRLFVPPAADNVAQKNDNIKQAGLSSGFVF